MKRKKLAAGTIAIVTAAAVTVTAILSNGLQSTYAQEAFSGLSEIVDGKEYKILEIVPDMSEAKLGLLVSGQESYYDPQTGHYGSLLEILSGLGTKQEREEYIQKVCNAYSEIVSGSNDTVLTFTPYQESYVPVEGYKQRSLTTETILGKDSSDLDGYYMKDLGENAVSGQYELDAKYIPAADGAGSSETLYSQNVSYYDYGAENKYYNVEFLLTDTVADGMGAYQPADGAPITQEMWDSMEPGELFYMLSSDGASFTLCRKSLPEETGGLATDGNGTEATDQIGIGDDGLLQVTEYMSNRFYMVYFEYVAPDKINTAASRYYYEPYSVTFAVDDSGSPAGYYGAVLDAAQPYVEDSADGHFVKDVDNMYYMKSKNGGRYELVKAGEGEVLTADQKLQYDVEVDSFYYTGGISSNDILKNAVFNQSGLLDEEGAELEITVDAVLPRNVTVEMANEYDLICLSNSFLYNLKSDPVSYAEDNDLAGSVADVIYSLVTDATVYKPVIVDASILTDAGVSEDTNIYKLARLLSSSNLYENTASYKDDTWTVTYGTSYADANSDGDSYFVNGNVFSVPRDGTELASDGLLGKHTFSFVNDFAAPFIEQTQAGRSEYENFSADAETAFQTSATELGFGEVAGCISDENFIRESENTSRTLDKDKYRFFDLSISRAICVEYIICYVSKRDTAAVDTIQILDIEPCTVSTVTQTTIETNIKNLLGITDTGLKVTFTHMTSAELISKVEDLCKYDLIYMGLYTDSMNRASAKRYYLNSDTKKEYPLAFVSGLDTSDYTSEYVEGTQYNDKSMDGLIYTGIGDIRKAKSFAGLLDTDYELYGGVYSHYYKNADGIWVNWYGASEYNYSTTRYSGNDLTEEKLSDLLDYVKSAAPVILADNFLTTVPQADGTYKRVVNDKKTLYTATKNQDGTYSMEATSNTINGTIDNCSRMYELINDIAVAKTYKNVKTYSEWQGNKSLLNRYITLGKPKLDVIESAKVDGEEYIKTDGDNVVIDFRVKAYGSVQTDASFTVDLFVDFNADGRYSKTTEKLDVYSYNIYLIDTKQNLKQKINPVTKTVDGTETTYYSLPALNGKTDNQYYSLEYAVQKSYLGVYPVKLVVEQQDNEYRYSYWEGYYYHEKTAVSTSEGTTKEVVKVIQILPDSLYDSSKTMFDMDLTGSYATGSETKNTKYAALFADKYKNHNANTYYNYSDVKTSLSGTYTEHNWNNSNEKRWNMLIDTFKHSSFYTYAFDTSASGNKLGGYELEIDSVFASSLAEYFTKQNADSTYTFDDAGYQEFFDYYDMLILGFGDAGNYFSSVNKDTNHKMQNLEDHYYTGIHNFIQSGKSVLFTHDTTSYESPDWISGDDPPTWKTGHLSDLLAGDVGFDRYGVYDNEDSLLSLALSAGIDNITKNGTRTFIISQYPSLATAKRLGLLAQYDKSLTAGSAENTISEATLFDIIVTESDEKHENKDVAYEPNSNRTVLTYEVQGRSTICINRQSNNTYSMTNFANELNGKTVTHSWGEGRTYSAELLNVGQILIYPYNVYDDIVNNDNLLNVAETHYQYFQIDMNADEDHDGESDITVWLSLTDKGNSYNYIEYDVAERDARNNYYIYTKGNITYSGVGHASINSDKYVAETQLYINTMIASYQATAQKPEVSIKESADSGSPDKDTIYISMDSSINVDSNGIGTVDDGTVSLDNDQITTSSYQTKTGSDGKKYWKADVTKKDGKNDVSTYEEAYLYIQDTNVTRGTVKQIKLNYYLMLDSKDDVPDEALKDLVVNLNEGKSGLDPEWAIPLNLETYSLTYDENGNEVPQTFDEQSEEIVSGKYYRMDIPYYVLAAVKKRAEVRCYVTTTISKKNILTGVTTKISESTSYDSVYLQRISLFDLE